MSVLRKGHDADAIHTQYHVKGLERKAWTKVVENSQAIEAASGHGLSHGLSVPVDAHGDIQ